MKKLIFYISCCFIAVVLVQACKKDNGKGTPPQNVQNITATPGYGNVMFTWSFPNDSDYLYVSVSYPDSTGKQVEQKFSKYTDTAVINGLLNKAYTFSVKAVSLSEASSTVQTFTVTPNKPIYDIIDSTLGITPGFGLVKIKWNNTTGQTLGVKVAYTDSTGTAQIASATSTAATDSLIIGGLKNITSTFVVTLSDASGSSGAPVTLTATPYLEIKISKKNWTITADSQQDDGEEPDPSGFATAAIDNDIATYWHTEYYPDEPTFPHWIVVDMKQQITVSRVELTPRQDHTDGVLTNFNIDGSNDGITWKTYGSFNLKSGNDTKSFSIIAPPNIRYIRMYATAGTEDYTHLAEFSVFGSM